MALESNRVRLLNDQAMRREGCNMVEVAYQKLSSSEDLRVKWQECFSEGDARGKEVIRSYKVTDAFEYKLVEEYSFISGFNDICTSLFIGAAWNDIPFSNRTLLEYGDSSILTRFQEQLSA